MHLLIRILNFSHYSKKKNKMPYYPLVISTNVCFSYISKRNFTTTHKRFSDNGDQAGPSTNPDNNTRYTLQDLEESNKRLIDIKSDLKESDQLVSNMINGMSEASGNCVSVGRTIMGNSEVSRLPGEPLITPMLRPEPAQGRIIQEIYEGGLEASNNITRICKPYYEKEANGVLKDSEIITDTETLQGLLQAAKEEISLGRMALNIFSNLVEENDRANDIRLFEWGSIYSVDAEERQAIRDLDTERSMMMKVILALAKQKLEHEACKYPEARHKAIKANKNFWEETELNEEIKTHLGSLSETVETNTHQGNESLNSSNDASSVVSGKETGSEDQTLVILKKDESADPNFFSPNVDNEGPINSIILATDIGSVEKTRLENETVATLDNSKPLESGNDTSNVVSGEIPESENQGVVAPEGGESDGSCFFTTNVKSGEGTGLEYETGITPENDTVVEPECPGSHTEDFPDYSEDFHHLFDDKGQDDQGQGSYTDDFPDYSQDFESLFDIPVSNTPDFSAISDAIEIVLNFLG